MNNRVDICKAAFSQADITPDFPVELIGCYREDNTARGVLHPLCAQVLLLERRGGRHCLIAVDSLGLTPALCDGLRSVAAEILGTDTAHVMVNFSHTHSAPAPLSPVNGQRYYALLRERVAVCVREAVAALSPCLAGWCVGEANIADNRREGCTAVDNRLGALQIVHAETRQPIAVLLRVCAHANVLMTGSNGISSDYFGPAREKLSAHFGCPVMLAQGAAGNLKPVGVDKIRGGDLSDIDRVSDLLAQSAASLRFEPKEIMRLTMWEREIDLCADVPTAEEAARVAAASGMDATAWLAECARLRDAGITCQTQRGSIHFLCVNEGCLCGVPDEIFCELALTAAGQAASPLLLNGYTNGCTGYLPHRAEWVKGGYETLYSCLTYFPFHGHVMPFRADTAERIVSIVVQEWESSR